MTDYWIDTPEGKYLVTPAYLRGASDRACANPRTNPFLRGPEHAQYDYGYVNESLGYHDAVDLPFERITHG